VGAGPRRTGEHGECRP